MRIVVIAIGKRHDAAFAPAIEAYARRFGRFARLEWRLFDPARGNMEQQKTRQLEARAITAELRPDDQVVLLDEHGQQWSSRQLAGFIESAQNRTGRLVFIIGGAHGVDDSVRTTAQYIWSLSALTFPHQLIRLLLAEQLYRASTIIRGEPYHH